MNDDRKRTRSRSPLVNRPNDPQTNKRPRVESNTKQPKASVPWLTYVPECDEDLPIDVVTMIRNGPFLLSFLDYIKVEPLQIQKQIQEDLREYQIEQLPSAFVGREDILSTHSSTIASFFTDPTAAQRDTTLYRTWESYEQYRDAFIARRHALAYDAYNSQGWLNSVLNTRPLSYPDLLQQWQATRASPTDSADNWLILTNLPATMTVASARTFASRASGMQRVHLSLPLPHAGFTRVAVVQYRSARARDDAVALLREAALPTVASGVDEDKSEGVSTPKPAIAGALSGVAADAATLSLQAKGTGIRAVTASALLKVVQGLAKAQQEVRVMPRGAPGLVGPRQWRQGPVPRWITQHRLTHDLAQARALALVLDSRAGLQHGAQAPWVNEDPAAELAALVSYLRAVHAYCYWSGARFPSLSQLVCEVGPQYHTVEALRARQAAGEASVLSAWTSEPEADMWEGASGEWRWAVVEGDDGDAPVEHSAFAARVDAGYEAALAWASTAEASTPTPETDKAVALCVAAGVGSHCVPKAGGRVQCASCARVVRDTPAAGDHWRTQHAGALATIRAEAVNASVVRAHSTLAASLVSGQCGTMCVAHGTCICAYGCLPLSAVNGQSLLRGALHRVWKQHAYDLKHPAPVVGTPDESVRGGVTREVVAYDEMSVANVPAFALKLWQ